MIPKRMLRVVLVAAFLCTTVHATEWLALPLHRRIELSDTIVVARVVDPAKALVSVERVFKGEPPKPIRLVSYIDGLKPAGQRTPLRRDARELLFLVKADDASAPLQTEYGRLAIEGDRLIDAFWSEPRRLSGTIASVERLVRLQARAASGDRAADRAYVEALRSRDPDVRSWPLETAPDRIDTPSRALTEAFLARWPGDARGVAHAAAAWRLREAAPTFARTLATPDADQRAFAARALGSTGELEYLPLLRRVAATDADPNVRTHSYGGIWSMLGTDSLADLRLAARDPDDRVRAQAAWDAYNMLELQTPQPRWRPASDTLIDQVRDPLT